MISPRTARILHAAATGIFALVMGAGGIADLIPLDSAVQVFTRLGYPLYALKIIGTAKVLGAAALLWGRPYALKEWAYAGFAIDLIGAAASHAFAGEPREMIPALALMPLLAASYVSWKRCSPPPKPSRN